MRRRSAALLLSTLTLTACASASVQPVTAPPRDSLEAYLRRSPAATAIAEAARAEGLLADSESNIADLEVVAGALGIDTIDELDQQVQEVAADAPMLFSALDERRRGSRTGDVAHWVAVALLALDDAPPAEPGLRADIAWQDDYLADVLALRQLYLRGELQQTALATVERQPEAYDTMVAPRIEPAYRPVFRARRQSGYWPVFDDAGARAIAATIAIERGEQLAWDALRVLVRTPGQARVIEPPETPLPRFVLDGAGALTPDGTVRLQRGGDLGVLVQLPGQSTLALLGADSVVEIPWQQNCCQLFEPGDVDWWLRLAEGDAAGLWLLASPDDFTVSWPALQAEARRAREARARLPALRLGPLPRAGMVEVYGGARLSYWLRGAPEGAPLFVLHDATTASSRMLHEPLGELLGDEGLLLFFYDPRGSGYSEGAGQPDLLTADRAVLDLDQMRRATELERIDLLAHSSAAPLALRYALDYPQHVGRIVLIDPVRTTDLRYRLERIAAPVLVVAEGADGSAPPASAAIAAELPAGRLELIEGIGDFPFELPPAFSTLVAGFLPR